MRNGLIVLSILLCSIASAVAQVSVGIGVPGVNIGINLPVYPELVPVPGYPVYYAPQVNSNYFFYDGMYWVYEDDDWYASSWYNGPWALVSPEVVPLFVLRVPVRYYRYAPVYFRGWRSDAPPRWGEHWGNAWEQSHRGWDNWNRNSAPSAAPLPIYQRQYSGNRYPRMEQQRVIQSQNYRYRPHDAVVQQHYQTQQMQSQPMSSPQGRAQAVPPGRSFPQQDNRGSNNRPSSLEQGVAPAPRGQPPQRVGRDVERPAAVPAPSQQSSPPAGYQRSQPQQTAPGDSQGPRSRGQDRGPQGERPAQGPRQGQETDREKGGEQRGGERNR